MTEDDRTATDAEADRALGLFYRRFGVSIAEQAIARRKSKALMMTIKESHIQEFKLELSRLMDKYGIDRQTARAALEGRPGPSKSLKDVLAVIEIAIQAEGLIQSLQDMFYLKDYRRVEFDDDGTFRVYGFDKSKVKKVKHCTAAAILSDQIERTSPRSGAERLRKEFKKREDYYRSLAQNITFIIESALRWSRVPWNCLPPSEEASLEREIVTIITDYPESSSYILHVTLPALRKLYEELSKRARLIERERLALEKRRQELEIIHRWHAIASFEGLAVSEGTGEQQLQEAVDGINALRGTLNPLSLQDKVSNKSVIIIGWRAPL